MVILNLVPFSFCFFIIIRCVIKKISVSPIENIDRSVDLLGKGKENKKFIHSGASDAHTFSLFFYT